MGVSFQEAFLSKNFVYVLIILLSSISLGIAIAFPSPTLADIENFFYFSQGQSSLFNAITSLSAVLGPFFTNLFVNTRGRCFALKIVALICSFSWYLFLSLEESQKWLAILFRALLGISAGGISAVAPVYINELSPANCRSIYGSMHQFGITVGIFLTNLLGILLTWVQLSEFSLFVSLLLFIGLFFVPETMSIKSKPTISTGEENSYNLNKESILHDHYKSCLIIGIMMMIFQQFSGINAVLSNLATIVTAKEGPTLAASAQCFSCLLCISVIEKIGRRKTWMISLFGSSFSIFLLAFDSQFNIPFLRKVENDGSSSSSISIIAAFAFLFFFCFGLGPIPWFLPPEMFPDRLRALALSILSSLNWIFSFIVILIYPRMTSALGMPFTLSIFAAILAAGGFYGMKVLNESTSKPKRVDEVPSFADVMVDI